MQDVSRIAGLAFGVLSWGSLLSPEDPRVLLAFHAYATAVLAQCQVACGEPGAQVTARFAERVVTLPCSGRHPSADAVTWKYAWYAALICRDEALLDALASIPEDVLRASVTRVDAYQFPWRSALIASRHDPTKTSTAVEETLVLSREATLPLAQVERTFGPVLAAIVQADEGAFDVALRAALLEHKAYWGKRERDSDDRAVIALGPLALTCFAYDRGIRARVTSDYLVPQLIERQVGGPKP
jgi:hypothetical protein